MPFQLHGVVKDAADPDHIGMKDTIEQEMAWMPDNAAAEPGAFPAMPQMKAANALTELWSIQAPDPKGIGSDVAHRRCQELLIA